MPVSFTFLPLLIGLVLTFPQNEMLASLFRTETVFQGNIILPFSFLPIFLLCFEELNVKRALLYYEGIEKLHTAKNNHTWV